MIILLYGENTYDSLKKLDQIKAQFLAKTDPSGINVTSFDAQNFDWEKFNTSLSQSGFLVSKRLIINKRILKNLNKEYGAQFKELLPALVSSEHIVVFWEEGLPEAKNEIFKLISKEKKFVQNFELPKAARLDQWVKDYVKEKGGVIDNPAANYLAGSLSANLWQLSNELDKLLAYADNKITLAKAQEMVSAKTEENIFGLVDAVAQGKKPQALKLLDQQLKSGLNEIYLLTMVIRQFRIISQLKSMNELKLSEAEIAKKGKIHPFVVKKSLPLARKFSWDRLKEIYDQLVSLDRKFKSTSLSSQALFELFIMKI